MSAIFESLFFVTEGRCTFHDIHDGGRVGKLTSYSIMVHHVRESDYTVLMKRFSGRRQVTPRGRKRVHGHRVELRCR